MNRRLHWLLTAILLVLTHQADAEQTKKVPRIGFLAANSPSVILGRVEAFRQGLRELGYAEGKYDRLPMLVAELVRLKVDLIIPAGPTTTHAAKAATATIPVVMTNDPDPVGNGFVASLAHPGGNITGLSRLAPELSGKQLQLLKESVPKLSRVAVLGTSTV